MKYLIQFLLGLAATEAGRPKRHPAYAANRVSRHWSDHLGA